MQAKVSESNDLNIPRTVHKLMSAALLKWNFGIMRFARSNVNGRDRGDSFPAAIANQQVKAYIHGGRPSTGNFHRNVSYSPVSILGSTPG